ncbi:hypothetical protein [Jiella endophytica]|uniref:hypothetical protein n=1 Tax=Jiella endophytica TaxID=2558362 RepID=UPI0014311532|nr:hypothetical protein [Jiella endophytica]
MKSDIGELRANLEYVRDMLEQLKVVSGAKSGAMLIYFLDLAKLEAEERIARLRERSAG